MSTDKQTTNSESVKTGDIVYSQGPRGQLKAMIAETYQTNDGNVLYMLDFDNLNSDGPRRFNDTTYQPRTSFFSEGELLLFMDIDAIDSFAFRKKELSAAELVRHLPKPEIPIEPYYLGRLLVAAEKWQNDQAEIASERDTPTDQSDNQSS